MERGFIQKKESSVRCFYGLKVIKDYLQNFVYGSGSVHGKKEDVFFRNFIVGQEIFNKKLDQGSFAYLPGPLDYVKSVLLQRSLEQGWAPLELRCFESSNVFVLIDRLPVAPPRIHIKNKIY